MIVYPIRDRISTAYLAVSGDTAMLIDAASDAAAPKVLAKLSELNVELRLIVLTHHHFDHVGAAESLRKATGAPIAIHHLDADGLRRGGRLQVRPTRLRGKLLAPIVRHANQAAVTPDLEITDAEELSTHGGIGQAFLTPGHTAGSISIKLPNGALVVGDALTTAVLPGHRAMPPMFADDTGASRQSIRTIADLASTEVLVAHTGRVTNASLDTLAGRARAGTLTY